MFCSCINIQRLKDYHSLKPSLSLATDEIKRDRGYLWVIKSDGVGLIYSTVYNIRVDKHSDDANRKYQRYIDSNDVRRRTIYSNQYVLYDVVQGKDNKARDRYPIYHFRLLFIVIDCLLEAWNQLIFKSLSIFVGFNELFS